MSFFVGVMLGVVHPVFCFLICKGQLVEQFPFSSLTLISLVGVGAVSGLLLWFWLGAGWGYKVFSVSGVKSPTERIVWAWSLIIPAVLLIVLPSLSTLTILYVFNYLGLFPVTFFSVFDIILGFFVMWALMNRIQVEEAIRVYPKPVIMLTMIGLFTVFVIVTLYLVYVAISSWQTPLQIQLFTSPLTWLLLLKTIPILNLPEAGRIVGFSGGLLTIYFITGAIIYMYFYYEYVKGKEAVKSGKIIIMEAGKDEEEKWRELKREFASLRGEVWASLPYLDDTSLDILKVLPKETKVRIITGNIRERKKFMKKLEEINNPDLSIVRISLSSEKGREPSPVIHDRIVIAENKILILGTDIKRSSLRKDTLILSFPTEQFENADSLVKLLKDHHCAKTGQLSEKYGEKIEKETIK